MTVPEKAFHSEAGKYRITDAYRPIARALLDKYPELSHIDPDRMLFVENVESHGMSKGKPRLACTRRVPEMWFEIVRQLTGRKFDYVIEFFRVNTLGLSRAQLVAVIYHELKHIGPDGQLVAHDLEDWGEMVATLGPGWYLPEAQIPDPLQDGFDWTRLQPDVLPGMGPGN